MRYLNADTFLFYNNTYKFQFNHYSKNYESLARVIMRFLQENNVTLCPWHSRSAFLSQKEHLWLGMISSRLCSQCKPCGNLFAFSSKTKSDITYKLFHSKHVLKIALYIWRLLFSTASFLTYLDHFYTKGLEPNFVISQHKFQLSKLMFSC